MKKDIKELTEEQLQSKINELEDTYAELFADDSHYLTMYSVWKEIKLLKKELMARRN